MGLLGWRVTARGSRKWSADRTASPATVTLGDTVTFTATVTAATGTPAGWVTFCDGASPLQIVAGRPHVKNLEA